MRAENAVSIVGFGDGQFETVLRAIQNLDTIGQRSIPTGRYISMTTPRFLGHPSVCARAPHYTHPSAVPDGEAISIPFQASEDAEGSLERLRCATRERGRGRIVATKVLHLEDNEVLYLRKELFSHNDIR
jgi:hypothetical protein